MRQGVASRCSITHRAWQRGLTNKDSFDRLSVAKERQSYQGLNEPGITLLSFAFAVLEDNPEGWRSEQAHARSVKHRACSWIEPGQPDAKTLGLRRRVKLSGGTESGQTGALTPARIFQRASWGRLS